MKTACFFAVIVFSVVCPAFAVYSVAETGKWPSSWPKELDPLRKQSRTLVGPMFAQQHFLIPFAKRESFESAWPYILNVKSKGAPIILMRGPKTDFMEIKPAGVIVHSPPVGTDTRKIPESPIGHVQNVRVRWMNTNYIELIVDGEIVDLNRIPFPEDTPIVDERFKGDHEESQNPSGN